MKPKLYLFDLDGTLADSAPDLAAAVNHVRETHNLEPLPFEPLRKVASSGARGLLWVAFQVTPKEPEYSAYQEEFLKYYRDHLSDNPKLFPGIRDLLKKIEENHAHWGIVTNKNTNLTIPYLEAVGLYPETLVCGDTLDRKKPFPDPILHALWDLDLTGKEAIYLGDDIRDIQAAQAAGVTSAVASWGYLGEGTPIEDWGADHILKTPIELLDIDLP